MSCLLPRPAPFWRRFFATTIDMFFSAMIVGVYPLGAALVTISVFEFRGDSVVAREVHHAGPDAIETPEDARGEFARDPEVAKALLLVFFPAVLSLWYYHARSESSAKMGTPGKMLLGLVVTSTNGDKISLVKATVRFLGKLLSFTMSLPLLGTLAGLLGAETWAPESWSIFSWSLALLLWLAFFPAAFTRLKRPLQDLLSGCVVIRSRRKGPESSGSCG